MTTTITTTTAAGAATKQPATKAAARAEAEELAAQRAVQERNRVLDERGEDAGDGDANLKSVRRTPTMRHGAKATDDGSYVCAVCNCTVTVIGSSNSKVL
jgi:hypothetical protein